MAAITRYSVSKTERSYDPAGVAAVLGSKVQSVTEAWTGGVAYPPATGTPRLKPTT